MSNKNVRIGSRNVDVSQLPLPGRFRSTHTQFVLYQPHPDQLRLLPHRGVRILAWVFCVLGCPVLCLGLFSILGLIREPTLANLVAVLMLLAWGLLFSILGVRFLGPRARFDTHSGEMKTWEYFRTRRWLLSDIQAVQVIDAGLFGGNSESDPFISYQLNLLLDSQDAPRVFLAYNSDVPDMAEKAKQLADFLKVPLLMDRNIVAKSKKPTRQHNSPTTTEREDPTVNWPIKDDPLPVFDLTKGALGTLTFGDSFEKAEFLGRPDYVECPGWMRFHYWTRGFSLYFEYPEFSGLNCIISPITNVTQEPDQGYARLRLSNGVQLTSDMTIEKTRELFGSPESEENTPGDPTRIMNYVLGRFYMEFEFEMPTGKLVNWSAGLDE